MTGWRPSATRDALERRAGLVRRVRAFFDARGLLEVETPALSATAPTDPNIDSVHADFRSAGRRWLQTSPEFPMKRLLAAGVGDCWQLARVFRDGERGALHRPEFTLLEWYRVGWDDHRLIDEVDALLRALVDGLGPPERVRYADAFERATGLAFDVATPDACARVVASHGVAPPDDGLTAAQWHDLVMGAVVTPTLGAGGPCFITDYPAEQAALARLRTDDPCWSGRFECIVRGVEVANGYHELTDPLEQRRRFEQDNAARRAAGRPPMPVDELLLAALGHGLPECAGVAVGFDRVVMLAAGESSLAGVVAFD